MLKNKMYAHKICHVAILVLLKGEVASASLGKNNMQERRARVQVKSHWPIETGRCNESERAQTLRCFLLLLRLLAGGLHSILAFDGRLTCSM
jgi:hypothetical protein